VYVLEEGKTHLLIKRADGSVVFKLKLDDRAFAEKILANLNRQESDRALS